MFGFIKNRRRKKLLEQPVVETDIERLGRCLWQARMLSPEEQIRLIRWSRVFVSEKNWEGCRGLSVTDDMRQMVAAAAGLMVLGHSDWYFDHTTTLLIYPRPYIARVEPRYHDAGLGGEYARSGETIYRGPVVLNWMDIARASRRVNGGHNLVIHEFAHQLDMINGPWADGLPPLPNQIDEQAWRSMMNDEYEAAREMVAAGHRILIDDYGLTQVSEFFAVASELYFQSPYELAELHPTVFQLLKQFYRLDLSLTRLSTDDEPRTQ